MDVSSESQSTDNNLYEHTACPQWGLAILAWERDDKRAFQFEDGKLRVFKADYFKLLKPVDRPMDEVAEIYTELSKKLGRKEAAKRLSQDKAPIPLDKQIEFFKAQFPDGLSGDAWTKKMRHRESGKALKRHRDPVIKMAAELLAIDAIKAKHEAGENTAVVEDMVKVLDATDLVSKAQTKPLRDISDARANQVVAAFIDLMSGDNPLVRRFEAWATVLQRVAGKKPSWALCTTLPALLAPSEHTCVKSSTMAQQAAWLAPSLTIGSQPSGRVYARVREMVSSLHSTLTEAGLGPRDYLDTYDFIDLTLKPTAVKKMNSAAK
jgi:hypothetical protein